MIGSRKAKNKRHFFLCQFALLTSFIHWIRSHGSQFFINYGLEFAVIFALPPKELKHFRSTQEYLLTHLSNSVPGVIFTSKPKLELKILCAQCTQVYLLKYSIKCVDQSFWPKSGNESLIGSFEKPQKGTKYSKFVLLRSQLVPDDKSNPSSNLTNRCSTKTIIAINTVFWG